VLANAIIMGVHPLNTAPSARRPARLRQSDGPDIPQSPSGPTFVVPVANYGRHRPGYGLSATRQMGVRSVAVRWKLGRNCSVENPKSHNHYIMRYGPEDDLAALGPVLARPQS